MTREKLKSLFEKYQDHACERYQESDAPHGAYYLKIQDLCKRALGQVGILDVGRIEKAMRWIGFIQGVLWSLGDFTVDELRSHSRRDDEVSSE